MLQYLTIVVTFAAVLIGVRGGTWDASHRRVTRVGFAAILLGGISCLLTAWQTHRDHQKLRQEFQEQSLIHAVACTEIKRAIDELTAPLSGIWMQYRDGDALPFAVLLTHPQFLEACKSVSPTDHVAIGNKTRWCDSFSEHAERAIRHFEAIQQKYSRYLSAAEIAALQDLINDAFVSHLVRVRSAVDEILGADYHPTVASAFFDGTFTGFRDPDGHYLPFVRKLLHLKELVEPYANPAP